MPRSEYVTVTRPIEWSDEWLWKLATTEPREQPNYCPECGTREGRGHALVHVGRNLPCGGWRRPCSLSNTLPMEE